MLLNVFLSSMRKYVPTGSTIPAEAVGVSPPNENETDPVNMDKMMNWVASQVLPDLVLGNAHVADVMVGEASLSNMVSLILLNPLVINDGAIAMFICLLREFSWRSLWP